MNKLIALASALALVFVGCNEKEDEVVDTKAEGEKVMQLSREWSKIAAEGDLEKTTKYWTDDAIVISAGQPPAKGKAALRKMVEDSYKMPGFRISWEPESVEVSKSGDMAYLIENSQMTFNDSTGKPMTVYNKAVSIWRKQADGQWKNVVDVSAPDPTQMK